MNHKTQKNTLNFQSVQRIILIVLYVLLAISFSYLIANIYHKQYTFLLFFQTISFAFTHCIVFWGLKKVMPYIENKEKWIVPILLGAMLIAQIVCGYQMEITPQWDFGNVYQAAVGLATEDDISQWGDYFYMFPNNFGILFFLAFFFRIANFFGCTNFSMVAIVTNAILNVSMMFFAYLICKRLFGIRSGFFMLYIFFVNLPSYLGAAVFYTDVTSMLFPVLTFYCYLKFRDATDLKKESIYAVLFALCSWLGFQIKFTVIIIAIAIGIELILRMELKKLLLLGAVYAVICLSCTALFEHNIYENYLDKETARIVNVPKLHWIMMGLEGSGGYNAADYEFTKSFTDPEARDKAIKEVISQRLDKLGGKGFFELATTKLATCFHDGTYSHTAFFYHGLVRESKLQPYVVDSGQHYASYKNHCTAIYLSFFLLMIVATIMRAYRLIFRKEDMKELDNHVAIAPYLSVLGLMIFLVFWETSSRYTVNYIPIIYLCACFGVSELFDKLQKN